MNEKRGVRPNRKRGIGKLSEDSIYAIRRLRRAVRGLRIRKRRGG